MTAIRAKVVLATSILLLVATGLVWSFSSSRNPRADLSGEGVRLDTTNTQTQRATSSRVSSATTRVSEPLPVLPLPPRIDGTPTTTPSEQVRPLSFPTRIEIPSLEVDATIVAVGLQPDGSMEIPPATVAGWYHYGPKPGADSGSAVIAGHVASRGVPGVFLKLRGLEVGAEVSVTDADGETHRYRVSERFQVGKEALPSTELFRTSGDPVLTLITCGGEFDRKARRYSDNVIIRALSIPTSEAANKQTARTAS
jgi:LPXTG-site transpeptidase (sortase) family protein